MAQAKKAITKTGGKLAARNAARAAVKTYHNYINGEWVASESGEMFENINPADNNDIVGRFPLSTSDDVNAAVNAAQGAFDRWRGQGYKADICIGGWLSNEQVDLMMPAHHQHFERWAVAQQQDGGGGLDLGRSIHAASLGRRRRPV